MIAMAEPLVYSHLLAPLQARLVTEKIQRFATFPAGYICQHNFQKTHSLRGLPDTFARREGAHRDTRSIPLIARFPCAFRLPLRRHRLGARWPTGLDVMGPAGLSEIPFTVLLGKK
ncbi:hypothetical protein EAG14_21830 [Acidovorax sp. 1608163]|nr:hypothetical protein EAG14_21830 [Acidovorax sp. 1608163]